MGITAGGSGRRRGWSVRVGVTTVALGLFVAACSDSSESDESKTPPTPSLPTGVEIVRPIKLTEDARVPDNDASLDHVEVMPDKLVFHYKAKPKIALAVGNVVAGAQGKGYLRRLESVAFVDDLTLEANTSHAYITDLILDGAFRVHTNPVVTDWVDVGSTAQALEPKFQVFTPTTNNGLGCSGAVDIKLDPRLDFDFDFDIDIDIEAQLFPPKGRLAYALMQAHGGVDVSLDVSTSEAQSGSCAIDLVKLLRTKLGNKDFLKFELPSFTVPLGPVVIPVTHAIEPTASIQASAQVEDATGVKGSAQFSLTMGAEYKNGQWLGIWKPSRSGQVTTYVPDSDGNRVLTASFTSGLSYKAFLWDVVGPKVGLEDFVQGELTADPKTCKWNSSLDVGVNVVIGAELQIPKFDYTLADWTQSFELAKVTLVQNEGSYGSCVDAGPDASPEGGSDGGDASADTGGPPDASDAGPPDGSTDASCADAPAPNGSPCSCPAGCASGFCVDGVCCQVKCDALCYSCSAAKKNSGPDGECGVTKSDTNPEGECPATTVCWGGLCKPPQGYPCTTPLFVGAEKGGCGGYWACRDGVCCNNTFCAEGNSTCTACTQAKTGQPDGTCATVFAGTDPFNSCGAQTCAGPSKPGTCQ